MEEELEIKCKRCITSHVNVWTFCHEAIDWIFDKELLTGKSDDTVIVAVFSPYLKKKLRIKQKKKSQVISRLEKRNLGHQRTRKR